MNNEEIINKKEEQLQLEKKRLDYIVNLINKEILNYVSKRKEIIEYITQYRKECIEEHKNDDDKVIDYFDHDRFLKEEAFRIIDKKLKELSILYSSPYFGKVIFKEEFNEAEEIYIGRFGMIPMGEYEAQIIDWRAPISSLFYNSKIGKSSYKAPDGQFNVEVLNKRQFIIKKSKLLGMFDSDLDIKDEILQRILSSNSSEKLKNIVMTIQKEQDMLIRQERNKTIVVNGVAGSGKTTVALHRVAYLLYNYRKILQNKVLVLGPNEIFIEYIGDILPGLGEEGVKQTTFKEFALDILHLDNIMSFKDYMEKILSGDKEFTEEVNYKNSFDFIKELNKLVDKMEYTYKIQNVKFNEDEIIIDKNEIKYLFDYYKSMPLFRRTKKIKRIIYSKIKDIRDKKVIYIQKEYEKNIAKMSKQQRNLSENNLNFERKIKIREIIEKVIKIKQDLGWINNCNIIDVYEKANGKKTFIYDDLAAILYLKIKLEGFKIKKEFKHIVIDEAQDYSPLQFIVIKELTKCKSFTIVGDSNQKMIPTKNTVAMLNIENFIEDLNIEHFNLNKSYRSTAEIMSYANKYLKQKLECPLVRNGNKVLEKQIFSQEVIVNIEQSIQIFKSRGYENIAVICKNLKCAKNIAKLLKQKIHIKLFDNENIMYTGGDVIIPSYFAKGLEFDGAVVIDDNITYYTEDKLMYILSTRALHELHVYKISN